MTHVQAFLKDEQGITTVEIILILVVLISLVIIFKKQLTLSLIHISEPTRRTPISYAVFCLKKKKKIKTERKKRKIKSKNHHIHKIQ